MSEERNKYYVSSHRERSRGSGVCKSEGLPRERITEREPRSRDYHRKRGSTPSDVSARCYKRPKLVNDQRSSRLSAGECTLEARESASGVLSIAGSKLRHSDSGKTESHKMDVPIGFSDEGFSGSMITTYTAILPKSYYDTGEDKVVCGTNKLEKLHGKVREMLQNFSRPIPGDCSFLSSESYKTTAEEKACSPNKDVKDEGEKKMLLVHAHLPANTPAKERAVFLKEKYATFGKGCSVNLNSAPPDTWHVYEIRVRPVTNFKFGKGLSKITSSDGAVFFFQGFTVLSPHSLDKVPKHTFGRYGGTYTIDLVPDSAHKNYTVGDILLFEEYFFVKVMEMYDWTEYMKPFCQEVFFIPRFCHNHEILSMAEVLNHMVESFQPLQEEQVGRRHFEGMLAVLPHKAPSCIRIDRILHSRRSSEDVLLEHYCSQLQRKARNYSMENMKEKKKLRDLEMKKEQRKLSQREHFELRSLREKFRTKSGNSSLARVGGEDHVVSLPVKGLYATGLYYDLPQNAILLPLLSHHIFFLDSLAVLQDRLGYWFHDVSLLHRALMHPSCNTPTFLVCEDHVRTAISNCGAQSCEFIKSSAPKLAKGMKGLIEVVKGGIDKVDEGTRLQNNEQLEFLGDAVLEYLCSHHLFSNHPDYNVGKLTLERQVVVKNKNLSQLADKLQLGDFLLKNTKAEFAENSASHISGNCVEAILGAVFLDGGLEEADRMFAELAFPEEEKHQEWLKYGTHPLVEAHPEGDRHLVEESAIFKKMETLEEKTGESFKHIRLLAKAFIHSSCNDTSITGGDYQRLEFLGDAILQFLTSKYVYHHFPAHNEGHLSLLRTSLVHNKQLSVICQEMDFQNYLITSDTEKLDVSIKIKADLVESYLAALTLDKGLEKAEAFLNAHLFPKLKNIVMNSQLVDANTRLNQAAAFTCKKQGLQLQLPVFKLVGQEGASDKPVFTVAVFFGKRKLGVGSGLTMREARSNASEVALQSGVLRIPPTQ